LLPIAGSLALLGAVTVWLAGRRDMGASVLPDRSRSRPATRLLGGVSGLTVRLMCPLALGWLVATVLAGLLFGLVAKTAARAVQNSGTAQGELARFGAHGGGARAYLGLAFLIVAVLIALAAAASVTALRGEEAEGRLDHLLARPVGRRGWLVGRAAAGAVLVGGCGILAALAAWAGAAAQGADTGVVRVLQAGINALPPALLVLGLGVLAFGLRPRLAAATCYALVAWSFLVLLVGAVVGANHWLLDTSLFRHMAAAPAVSPDWTADAMMTALAVFAALIGTVAFARRDLAGE